MASYLARRAAWLGLALFGVSVITFALGVLAPGDPAEVVVERRLNQPPPREQVEEERRILGLDKPLPQQYLTWLGRAVQGDLGRSWLRDLQVSEALRQRVPRTAALAGAAAGLSVLIGVPVGVLSAARRNSLADHLCRVGALLGASIPSYFAAYLLILAFAVTVHALPVFGFGTPAHLVLPAVTLALGPASALARLTRSSVLEVLGEDYVRTARAMGLAERTVIGRYALKNALTAVVTLAGLLFAGFITGIVIVETVFAWPGVGRNVVDAIFDRDYAVIRGFVVFTGTVFVLVNLTVDLLYLRLDPRVRLTAKRGSHER